MLKVLTAQAGDKALRKAIYENQAVRLPSVGLRMSSVGVGLSCPILGVRTTRICGDQEVSQAVLSRCEAALSRCEDEQYLLRYPKLRIH